MVDDAPRLSVSTRSGSIHISATATSGIHVQGGDLSTDDDGSVRVTGAGLGSHRVEVECAPGTHVLVGTASGHVELHGSFGDVRVTTRSGRITLDDADDVDLRAASGAIQVGSCAGTCRIVTRSSKIHVGRAGTVDVATMSGRVAIGHVDDAVVRTMSGRVELTTGGGGRIEVRTLSGSVAVAVPGECRPSTRLRSMSGRVRCAAPPGHDGEISVATTSGTIDVTCK